MANAAYRKAVVSTREKVLVHPEAPGFLKHLVENLPEDDSAATVAPQQETSRHRKIRVLQNSENPYNRFAFLVYEHITSKAWFETFIMANIVLVGVAMGIDLENDGRDDWCVTLVSVVEVMTLVVFSLECVLKIVAEGLEPWRYVTDPQNGTVNTFDFVIVVASLAFVNSSNGSTLSALRMLRLVRLMTLVKGAPVLRVIVIGLIQGMKSVVYIVVLLLLVIYIFAILGSLLFGLNDPARFGTVPSAMLTLFQVSTLTSWSTVAYTSWYGCANFIGSPYAAGTSPSKIHTDYGEFEGFKCDRVDNPQPVLTGLFFSFYILSTAWVIMTLFIGVISMDMFKAWGDMKDTKTSDRTVKAKDRNLKLEVEGEPVPYLKSLIDRAFDESLFKPKKDSEHTKRWKAVTAFARKIRDSQQFVSFIAFTIFVVGIKIGIDTDATLECARMDSRAKAREAGNDDDELERKQAGCGESDWSFGVDIAAQAIFTLEMTVKLLAEGSHPLNYFTDADEGSWNCLDFLIVAVGFMEMTPAAVVFQHFPVVILRLVRLIRVFRLAKTLPRLRAIVEALLSGFSAVGWICVLIATFNYIAACTCIVLFKDNDPFHFGSLGRAMFSVQRISTLETWDQLMYIAIYGCDEFPKPFGYDFTEHKMKCRDPYAFGWIGVAVFVVIVILGAFILPIVLVGIISIKFDESSTRSDTAKLVKGRTKEVIAAVQHDFPGFFTEGRVDAFKRLFDAMDCKGHQAIELPEATPYLHYIFDFHFGVLMRASEAEKKHAEQEKRIFNDRSESLFQIMDTTKSGDVSFDEFMRFNAIVKKLLNVAKQDKEEALKLFGPNFARTSEAEWVKASWNRAMHNVDQEGAEAAWDAILHALAWKGQITHNSIDSHSHELIRDLFKDFDSDGSAELDYEELTLGLRSIGVHLTDRQMRSLFSSLDVDGDGDVSLDELVKATQAVLDDREARKIEHARKEANLMMAQADAKEMKRKGSNPSSKTATPQPARRKLSRSSASGLGRARALTARYDWQPDVPSTIEEVLQKQETPQTKSTTPQQLEKRIAALGFSSVEAMVRSHELREQSSTTTTGSSRSSATGTSSSSSSCSSSSSSSAATSALTTPSTTAGNTPASSTHENTPPGTPTPDVLLRLTSESEDMKMELGSP